MLPGVAQSMQGWSVRLSSAAYAEAAYAESSPPNLAIKAMERFSDASTSCRSNWTVRLAHWETLGMARLDQMLSSPSTAINISVDDETTYANDTPQKSSPMTEVAITTSGFADTAYRLDPGNPCCAGRGDCCELMSLTPPPIIHVSHSLSPSNAQLLAKLQFSAV